MLQSDSTLMDWYKCEIKRLDPVILALGLSQPALRALVNLSIYTREALIKKDANMLLKAHGIGPNALKKLETLR